MVDFATTGYARKLFEADIPRVIEKLDKIGKELEALVVVTSNQNATIAKIYELAKASEDAYKDKPKEEENFEYDSEGNYIPRGENPGMGI